VIVHAASDFRGAGGIRLYRRSRLPAAAPRAAVALVHGYAEHSGRYDWVGEQFANAGIALHGYDLRGHGRSDGPRARVKSFREHLDDLDAFLAIVRGESAAPLFLFGHSMGGLIAALYVAVRQPDLRGLILSGPAVAEQGRGARLFGALAGAAAKAVPGLKLRKLRASGVSRDPAVVKAYETDPLVYHGGVPLMTIGAATRAVARLHRDARNIRLPLLIVHGTADELAPAEGAQALFDRAGSNDRVLKLYEGLAHEVLNEPEKERVLADILQWLDAHA
jgi:alpha-beta hydrolase superfamily lysophospholipase